MCSHDTCPPRISLEACHSPFSGFQIRSLSISDVVYPASILQRHESLTTPTCAGLQSILAPMTFNFRKDPNLANASADHGCLVLMDDVNPIPARTGKVRKVQPTRSRAS